MAIVQQSWSLFGRLFAVCWSERLCSLQYPVAQLPIDLGNLASQICFVVCFCSSSVRCNIWGQSECGQPARWMQQISSSRSFRFLTTLPVSMTQGRRIFWKQLGDPLLSHIVPYYHEPGQRWSSRRGYDKTTVKHQSKRWDQSFAWRSLCQAGLGWHLIGCRLRAWHSTTLNLASPMCAPPKTRWL